jgi:hypothetical protein
MDPQDPLPRLLRLRRMVVRALPEDSGKVGAADTYGLTESYNRLRDAVRSLNADTGGSDHIFDAELPPIPEVSAQYPAGGPRVTQEWASKGRHAAVMLRQLAGWVEGMVESTVIDQKLSQEQIKAAQEAARQPPGFR